MNKTNEVPFPCQFASINLKDDKELRDERVEWLPKSDKDGPIWSRLKVANCLGHLRDVSYNRRNGYDVEIPGRLWSMWGNSKIIAPIANDQSGMHNFESFGCVLALCAALKYNLNSWTKELLNTIYIESAKMYPDFLTRQKISDKNCHLNDLNSTYKFERAKFMVTLEQTVTGFVYMPYGFNEFNIARALSAFFNIYQFGIIHCNSKSLAFGFCVDYDDGYFMFDCQSKGRPLLQDNEVAPYILRCSHLQILLYCILVTFNISRQHVPFSIHYVDINMEEDIINRPRLIRSAVKKGPTDVANTKSQQKMASNSPITNIRGRANKIESSKFLRTNTKSASPKTSIKEKVPIRAKSHGPTRNDDLKKADNTIFTPANVKALQPGSKRTFKRIDAKNGAAFWKLIQDETDFESISKKGKPKDAKESMEPKASKESNEPKQLKRSKESNESKEPKEPKDPKELRKPKVPKKLREPKASTELKESKESKDSKDPKGAKDSVKSNNNNTIRIPIINSNKSSRLILNESKVATSVKSNRTSQQTLGKSQSNPEKLANESTSKASVVAVKSETQKPENKKRNPKIVVVQQLVDLMPK